MIIRSSITEDDFSLIASVVEYEFFAIVVSDAYKIARQIYGYTSSSKEAYYSLWKHKLKILNTRLNHVLRSEEKQIELTDDDIKIILCSLLGDLYWTLHKSENLKYANKEDLDWITYERNLIRYLIALNPQFKKFEKLLK